MSFMGNPCACGYSTNDNEDGTKRTCSSCGREYLFMGWGWMQVTPKSELKDTQMCKHKHLFNEKCRQCERENEYKWAK